ncbi:MAG: tyrosine-type recombinase/integrase [Flavobacteriaceae bacterium]
MASVKFLYRSSKDFAPLTLRLTHKANGQKIDLFANTQYSINKTDWNFKKNEIKGRKSNHTIQKKTLLELSQTILDEFNIDFNSSTIIDKDWLLYQIGEFFGRNDKKKKLEFNEFYLEYIDTYSKLPLPNKTTPYSPNTIKTYKSIYKLLKEFQEEYYTLTFDKINLQFHNDYTEFLINKEHKPNYIGNNIKTIKTIMNASFERGLHQNLEFKKKAFSKQKETPVSIYLNTKDIQRISELDLTKEKSLDKSRDIFLLGTQTGLRISDLTNLEKAQVLIKENTYFLRIKPLKTKKSITIPLSEIALAIYKKYNNNFPKSFAEPSVNKHLKVIGKLAQLNTEYKTSTTRGKNTIDEVKEKWELITTHTARRSFCTNAYISGMPTADIMAISGHTTEKIFYNYIKISDEERATKISKASFFRALK